MKAKHGGKRIGSGAKMKNEEKSRKKTIALLESVARYIENQPNQTQYINNLVQADMRKLTDRSG